MGYYTHYSCEIRTRDAKTGISKPNLLDEIINKISIVSGYDTGLLFDGECVKWYDWESDVKKVSWDYPDVMIIICGTGEESHDVWKAVFLNGGIIWRWKLHPGDIFPKVPDDVLLAHKFGLIYGKPSPPEPEPEPEPTLDEFMSPLLDKFIAEMDS